MSVTELNLACCAVEAAEGVARWREITAERGEQGAGSGSKELNVLVVSGTVTTANLGLVRSSFDELEHPRAVVAFGVCTISGGPYWDSYAVVPGITGVIPVDVVVPGCPPQPEDVVAALESLANRDVRA